MNEPSNPTWLMNDYPKYVKHCKKKDCPRTMEKYIDSEFKDARIKALIAQLFWETYKLRTALACALIALDKLEDRY